MATKRPRIIAKARLTNDPNYKYAKVLSEVSNVTIYKALAMLKKYETISQARMAIKLDELKSV